MEGMKRSSFFLSPFLASPPLPSWQESIVLIASQYARDLENMQESGVEQGVENVGKRSQSTLGRRDIHLWIKLKLKGHQVLLRRGHLHVTIRDP